MSEGAKDNFASRFFHGVKDAVWQDDPSAPKPVVAPKAPAQIVTKIDVAPTPVSPQAISGMAAELMTVVMASPTPYAELSGAIASLAAITMDDGTRYRAAFAVLANAQPRTVAQISQAIDVHLEALETECKRFADQSKGVEENELSVRTQESTSLADAVDQANTKIAKIRADAEAEVVRLQESIVANQSRIASLAVEIDAKQKSITQKKQSFDAATEIVKNTLIAEKSKIQQYLA